jgi:hypothetical protein
VIKSFIQPDGEQSAGDGSKPLGCSWCNTIWASANRLQEHCDQVHLMEPLVEHFEEWHPDHDLGQCFEVVTGDGGAYPAHRRQPSADQPHYVIAELSEGGMIDTHASDDGVRVIQIDWDEIKRGDRAAAYIGVKLSECLKLKAKITDDLHAELLEKTIEELLEKLAES